MKTVNVAIMKMVLKCQAVLCFDQWRTAKTKGCPLSCDHPSYPGL